MLLSKANDRQVLEFVKNEEHFVLVYPRTPTGRIAAKAAVRNWLIDCDLEFNRLDAEALWKAIDASCFRTASDCFRGRDLRWPRRRP